MSQEDLLKSAQEAFKNMPSKSEISDYQTVAAQFTASDLDYQKRTQLGLGGSTPQYITTDDGWIRLPNGVLANPETQAVIYPPRGIGADPATIEGSEQWLRAIQETWSDKKFNNWRSKLISMGYDTMVTGGIAEKGGAALDVIDGMRAFFKIKYLNGGKPIAAAPVDQATREQVRSQVDYQALKERVKTWGEVPFGEQLDPATADYFADQIVREMTQLARKHPTWTLEQVSSGADMRVQKDFLKTPGVKSSVREAEREEDEMSTRIEDTFVSIAQLQL